MMLDKKYKRFNRLNIILIILLIVFLVIFFLKESSIRKGTEELMADHYHSMGVAIQYLEKLSKDEFRFNDNDLAYLILEATNHLTISSNSYSSCITILSKDNKNDYKDVIGVYTLYFDKIKYSITNDYFGLEGIIVDLNILNEWYWKRLNEKNFSLYKIQDLKDENIFIKLEIVNKYIEQYKNDEVQIRYFKFD